MATNTFEADYEKPHQDWIIQRAKLGKRPTLFIDVGACIGEYSIRLARYFDEVWSFEPNPLNRKILEENITKFGIKNIKIFPFALSEVSESKRTFYVENEHIPTGMGGLEQKYERTGFGTTVLRKSKFTVETRTLSEMIVGRQVTLIKVDTEGHEFKVLKGAIPVLKRIDNWVLEIHDYSLGEYFKKFFIENGYSVTGISHIYAWRETL